LVGESSRSTSRPRQRSALRSGLLTGLSTLALSGSAAAAGAILAQKFGHNARTDGFLAAYGIYLVLTLGAQAFRLVVVPDLTRAATAGRLAPETRAYLLAFLLLAVPTTVLVIVLAHPLGDAITGSLPASSASIARRSLVWLVPAAFAQLFAAIAASALAARDDYGTAAVGYAAGGISGLVLFLALADSHGLVALAWGLMLNGAISFGVPFVTLTLRGELAGGEWHRLRLGHRLWRLVQGAAVPVAIQGFYLIAIRLAADIGVGRVTTFSYAYLIAAMLVAVTASSISFISSAPLTRRGLDDESAARHIVYSSWISLVAIAAAAGVFALVGGRVAAAVLGSAYGGDVGRELGRLVVYLAPWMLVSVAFSVTFPLLFVMGRVRTLVPLAVVVLVLHVPIAYGLRQAAGLAGIAIALALSTAFVLVVMLASLSRRALVLSLTGLVRLAVVQALLAAASFGAVWWLGGVPAAAAGLAVYLLLLAAIRPRPLREAWAYVRALH
jgi:peptidoglycan biosynthesis protein MviN/MurJ (putative lipid II flippase)